MTLDRAVLVRCEHGGTLAASWYTLGDSAEFDHALAGATEGMTPSELSSVVIELAYEGPVAFEACPVPCFEAFSD